MNFYLITPYDLDGKLAPSAIMEHNEPAAIRVRDEVYSGDALVTYHMDVDPDTPAWLVLPGHGQVIADTKYVH